MARKAKMTSGSRRALVANFVRQGLVTSQGDIVDLLAGEGIEVTQATASRDLEEIGAVRGRDGSGVLRYQLMTEATESRTRIDRVSDELILSMTASGNLVVVKTLPGGAQLLASTLDRAATKGELDNLIGTIAGDDTVLAVSKSVTGGSDLSKQLNRFIANVNSKRKSKGARK